MDVSKLMKRSHEPDSPPHKRARGDDYAEASSSAGASAAPTVSELVEHMEEIDAPTLDAPGLKKMVLQLERSINKNQQLRVKYAGQPEKFIESEADLDEELKRFHAVATVPHLYGILVSLGVVASLVGLLSHENTDIAIDVVELLKEMTDADSVAADGAHIDQVDLFIDELGKQLAFESLIQNLRRLNESVAEDSQGVFSTLAVCENLMDIRPSLAETLAEKTDLLSWLLKRIQVREFTPNKQYASEVLSIMLQGSKANRLLLAKQNGLDTLLMCLNAYKRRDPAGGDDEVEFMENLFDALCSALMEKENKVEFKAAEGFELMIMMIKEKKLARKNAVKVLAYALSGFDATESANHFIDVLGLGTLFAAFMQKGLKKLKKSYKGSYSESAEEEHSISVISALIQYSTGDFRRRLFEKFTEESHEKLDRLIELYFTYTARSEATNRELAAERRAHVASGDYDAEDMATWDAVADSRRLDGGLFVLRLVCASLGAVAAESEGDVSKVAEGKLRVRGGALKDVVEVLKEYAGVVGEGEEEEVREKAKKQILGIVEKIGEKYL